MRPEEVIELIDMIAGLWPSFRSTGLTIPMYADVLADVARVDAINAVRIYGREDHEWAPSAGKIRSLAREFAGADAGVPTADEAWLEFHKAWKASSQFDSPPADDAWSTPLVAVAARRIPGWHALRSASSEDMKWHAKDFRAAYTEALSRRRFDETAEAVRTLPLPRGLAAISGGINKL